MSVFDPQKAFREEIEGLTGVRAVLRQREQQAQKIMGEAEEELNALIKLRGFADAEIERKRAVLKQLQEQTQ